MRYTCSGPRPLDEEFDIQFGECRFGWIQCRVCRVCPGFSEEAVMHCSWAFDPFPGLIAWLEAIVRGADEASWVVNEEGSYARLRVVRKREVLVCYLETAAENVPTEPWHEVMTLRVRTADWLSRVYREWRAFVESPRFSPDQWGVATRLDHWRHRVRFWLEAEVSANGVESTLAGWSRDAVVAVLFWSCPAFVNDVPEVAQVPQEWDSLDCAAREKAMAELLAERTDCKVACDPRTLKSAAVEEWLRKHAPLPGQRYATQRRRPGMA